MTWTDCHLDTYLLAHILLLITDKPVKYVHHNDILHFHIVVKYNEEYLIVLTTVSLLLIFLIIDVSIYR